MSSLQPFVEAASTSNSNINSGGNESKTLEVHESSSSTQQQGIDIRTALEILSNRSRPKSNNINQHRSTTATSSSGCPHCSSATIPEEAKSMGQTILLHDEGAGKDNNIATAAVTDLDPDEQRQALAQERSKRQVEILAKLEAMSSSELIHAVLEAQRERVVAYRDFDRGLDQVLQTGNMSDYPAVCARATASFAVLSDTITTIQSILRKTRQQMDVAQLIANLQVQEREKLNLTAALHLERIRFESSSSDESVRFLLQEGISTLRAKVIACVENINEILDDIRMEITMDAKE